MTIPRPAPWNDLDSTLPPVPSRLGAGELKLLHWLAATGYEGTGEIVDLGSGLGASAAALASGLAANPRDIQKGRRVHCFDRFVAEAEAPGHSTLNAFHRNTRPWAEHLRPHPGEIADQHWLGWPIELLVIGTASDWAATDLVVRRFLPPLIPGHATVVQADLLWGGAPWAAVLTAHLGHYLEIVGAEGRSVAFRYRRRIPESYLEGVGALPTHEKLRLLDQWREEFDRRGLGAEFRLSRAVLLATCGEVEAGREVVADLLRDCPQACASGSAAEAVIGRYRLNPPPPRN